MVWRTNIISFAKYSAINKKASMSSIKVVDLIRYAVEH